MTTLNSTCGLGHDGLRQPSPMQIADRRLRLIFVGALQTRLDSFPRHRLQWLFQGVAQPAEHPVWDRDVERSIRVALTSFSSSLRLRVAQSGSAPLRRSGCRRFESCREEQLAATPIDASLRRRVCGWDGDAARACARWTPRGSARTVAPRPTGTDARSWHRKPWSICPRLP